MGGVAVGEIEEVWHALAPPYDDLFAWLEGAGRAARSPRRPAASGR